MNEQEATEITKLGDTKVVNLFGEKEEVQENYPEHVRAMIGVLEQTLQEAKSGAINAYCLIKMDVDNHWTGFRHSKYQASSSMVGALEVLKNNIIRENYEDHSGDFE